LLLLFWQCYAQPFPNPPACIEANPWATNLVNAVGRDPCQVHQQLKELGFSISCCFNDQDIATVGQSKCGPCNQQSYNLLGACIACVFAESQENSDLEFLQPPPPFSPNHFPAFSQWNQGDRKDPLPAQLVLPPWINISPNNNIFDLQSAIAIGSKSLASSPPATAAPPVISPQAVAPSGQATSNDSPSSSSLGSPAISPTVITETQPLNNGMSLSGPTPSSSSSNKISSGASKHNYAVAIAGAIAGTVTGALFALGLVFGAFFIIRRRRRARTPPSAQFDCCPARDDIPVTDKHR